MAKIEEQVTNLINEQVLKNGYEIYDLEYIKEGNEYYLRIFIEKPEGNITLEDCEKVNDIVNPILDEADIIKEQYFLEVSSTGVEKKLRKVEHYKKVLGKEIKVKLFKKDAEGNKEVEGKLLEVKEKEITIEKNGKNINIKLDDIAKANTVYKW